MNHETAQARRFYLHVLHGGSLTPGDVALMVKFIERRDAEIAQFRDALEVDRLSAIIRKVDGQNSLGAGALAEAILAEMGMNP